MVDQISSIFDVAKILGETEQVTNAVKNSKTSLVDLYDTIQKFKGSNITDLAANAEKLNGSIQGTTKANSELITVQRQLNAEIAKRAQLESDLGKALAISKDQTKQLATEVRQAAQLANSASDTYKGLVQQYEAAARAAKDLAVSQGTSSQAFLEASSKAKVLGDQLKVIDASVGQHQRNVGNYSGALQILQEELASVNKQLSEMDKLGKSPGVQNLGARNPVGFDTSKNKGSGPVNQAVNSDAAAYEKLSQQASALTTILSQQEAGFNSVTQQVRSSERALQTLRAAGLDGSAGFDKLRESTVEAARAQKEFQREQKLLEGQFPILKALTIAAKGLAGTYEVGAGASALFGGANEKLDKELNKLVAVMTILQGLQEAYELIQEGGAIAMTFRAAQTAVVTAATEAYTYVTEEASAATLVLDAALAATGIAAFVALVVVASKAMNDTAKEEQDWVDKTVELTQAISNLNDVLLDESHIADQANNNLKKNLENELTLLEKNNASYLDLFAVKKQIAEVDKTQAENDIKTVGHASDLGTAYKNVQAEIDGYKKKLEELKPIADTHMSFLDAAKIAIGQTVPDAGEQIDRVKASIDAYQKDHDAYKKLIEDKQKLLDTYNSAQIKQTADALELNTFTEKEQIAISLQGAKIRAEAIIGANNLILANDESTQKQRIAAERNILREQLAIVAAEEKAKLADTSLTPGARTLVENESQANRVKAVVEGNEKVRKINEEYAKREHVAQMGIIKNSLTEQAKQAEDFANDDKNPIAARLAAFDTSIKKQMEILRDDANFEKSLAGKTANEKFEIEVEYQKKLNDLLEASQKKRLAMVLKGIQDQTAATSGENNLKNTRKETAQLEALNKEFEKGSMSVEKFNQKKADINSKDTLEGLKEENELLKFQRGELANNGASKQLLLEKDIQIAANEKHIAETSETEAEKLRKEKDKRDTLEIKAAEEVGHAVTSFVDGAYEKQLNLIQRKIDLNNIAHENETKAIADSTLSNQEKAAAQIMLDAKINAENMALQRQQRDIKIRQAKFDRDVAVAQVIEQTAIGIMAALRIPVYGEAEAIAIGVIGAAQVASILARPIPTYGFGTKDHPGGPAITGDRFMHELIQEPGKDPYLSPNTPTLMDLKPHTRVIPIEDIRRMAKEGMQVNRFGKLEERNEAVNETRESIQWLAGRIERALAKNRPVTHVHVSNFWTQIKNDI